MSLTPDEAARSLRDATDIELRSREALGYSRSSPFLLLLGLFWLFCYGGTQFWPQQSGYIWIAGMACFGVAMRFLGAWLNKTSLGEQGRRISRNLGIVFSLILPAFVVASLAVMHAWTNGIYIGVFIPLAYATLYTGMGLWLGRRYTIAGSILFVVTLAGFYFAKEYFALWMAIFGGGTMIVAGLWLRKP